MKKSPPTMPSRRSPAVPAPRPAPAAAKPAATFTPKTIKNCQHELGNPARTSLIMPSAKCLAVMGSLNRAAFGELPPCSRLLA